MRKLLTLTGIGILTAAAWAATAGAHGHGHGSGSGSHGHGGLEGHMRHHEAHAEAAGMGLLIPYLLAGQEAGHASPERLVGGPMVVGEPEHPAAGPVAGPEVRPAAHSPLRPEGGQATVPLPADAGAGPPDRGGASAAQSPYPTVSPWSPRPPGAAGPGRPVSGQPGPGRRGPGQPAAPRW
jgi:hypothetical protein